MIFETLVRSGTVLCFATAMAVAVPLHVDITSLLFDTGAQGTADFGMADPHWTVDGETAYVTNLTGNQFPVPYWLGDKPGDPSAWISPSASYSTFGSDSSNTTFDFRTTLDLTGYDPLSASVVFRYLADNQLTDVQINGISVGYAGGSGLLAWSGFSTLSGAGVFKGGVNTFDFFVYNGAGSSGNPAGLRVDFTGEVSPLDTLTPEPRSTILIGSGILLFGVLLRALRRKLPC